MAKEKGKKRILDDMTARNAKAKKSRYELADGEGLFLRIMPSGARSWTLRYVFDDEQKRMALGKYPAVSLSSAREKQAQALKDIGKGTDPAAKANEEKRKRITAPTFDDLLDEFWKRELKDKPTGSAQKRLVTKDVLPLWKKRKVSSITRRDAVLLIDDVRERAPVTANRLQTVLARMFNFAAERGILDFSPLVGMRRRREQARVRVLTDDEIRKLWSALDLENEAIDMYVGTKLALKAILLTGQRPGEVCGMTWDEIKDGFWIIPANRAKAREVQQVPLTALMLDILEQARVYCGKSRFVFPSPLSPVYGFKHVNTKEDDQHLTRLSLSHGIRRHWLEMGFDGERFTPHDLRRTLRTRLAALGVDNVIAERTLGHKLQGILAVYNRYDYAAEKREALEKWENSLKGILNITKEETNVIPFEVQNG